MLSSVLASGGLTHQLNGEHPCWPVVWSEKPDTPLADPWPERVQHPSPGQAPGQPPPMAPQAPDPALASLISCLPLDQKREPPGRPPPVSGPLYTPALPEVSSHLVGSSLPWRSEASPGHTFKQHPTASIPTPSPCFPAVTLPARQVVSCSVHPATKMEAPCRPRIRRPCSLGLEVASTSDLRRLLSDKRLSPSPPPRRGTASQAEGLF